MVDIEYELLDARGRVVLVLVAAPERIAAAQELILRGAGGSELVLRRSPAFPGDGAGPAAGEDSGAEGAGIERSLSASANVVRIGGLAIEMHRREITVGGRRIALTRIEMGILGYLLSREGHVVSYQELAGAVWDRQFTVDAAGRKKAREALRPHIYKLRRKLCWGATPELQIKTIAKQGYRLRLRRLSAADGPQR